MKRTLSAFALVLAFGAASLDADAARRFGGGSNIGKQRAVPTQKQATPPPAATPAPGQAAPAAAPAAAGAGAAAAAKPSFMGRWGGLLAGLGIGMLLTSLFGAQMGPIIGMILAVLLGVALIALLFKIFGNRGGARPAMAAAAPAASGDRPRFSGIGSGVPGARTEPTMSFDSNAPQGTGVARAASAGTTITLPPDLELQPFLRVAKTSFIRLQAANDSGDLSDIRDYTTPEMYAEIAMQLQERAAQPQKTEVVSLEAQLVDAATEDGFDVVSVRFYGLIREDGATNPESFDELWHVRRKAGDRKDSWLIAGIQQNP